MANNWRWLPEEERSPNPPRPLAAWLMHQMQNSRTWHQRFAARWLRRRGWVVFYLEDRARFCPDTQGCWLNLYQQAEAKEKCAKEEKEGQTPV